MDLEQFKYELDRRGISQKDVPRHLMTEGRIATPLSDALPVFQNATKKVLTGATLGTAGSLLLGDKLKVKNPVPLALGGMALGGAIGGYLHNKEYIKNGRMRGIYRDKYLGLQSDMSKVQGETKLPVDERGETKVPERSQEMGSMRPQRHFDGEVRKISKSQSNTWSELKSIMTSKWGKIILTGTALATIAAIAKPRIITSLKSMNTKQIDFSNYTYSDDANKVQKCISRFSDFLSNDPVKQAAKFRYPDMERIYLDALESIDRSSPNREVDSVYLETYWHAIYACYNASLSKSQLDSNLRLDPNHKSLMSIF